MNPWYHYIAPLFQNAKNAGSLDMTRFVRCLDESPLKEEKLIYIECHLRMTLNEGLLLLTFSQLHWLTPLFDGWVFYLPIFLSYLYLFSYQTT